MDLINIVNIVASSPLHVMLFIMIVMLWRRVTVLEGKLEKCLKDTAKSRPKP